MHMHKSLKLFLLMLLAPLIVMACEMICVGERKEISQNRRSARKEDTHLTIYTLLDEEAPKIVAAEKKE